MMRGAVRLFRDWYNVNWQGSPVRLRSVSFLYEYCPGVNISLDLQGGSSVAAYRTQYAAPPPLGYGPGFYGYLHPMASPDELDMDGRMAFIRPRGTILGFGKVSLHERGAICEKVVVESLVLPSEVAIRRVIKERPTVNGRRLSGKRLRETYEELAAYYGCLLIPEEVYRDLPGGFIDDQPIPGVGK